MLKHQQLQTLLENMGEITVMKSQVSASENQSPMLAVSHNYSRPRLTNILQSASAGGKFACLCRK